MATHKERKSNPKMSNATDNGKPEIIGNIERIPLTYIHVDPNFNARSASSYLKDGTSGIETVDGKDTGINGLSLAIQEEGQDTPVDVRRNPDPKTSSAQPYALVAGFRRFEAIKRIAERGLLAKDEHPIAKDPSWSSARPSIKAIVRIVTESEARLLNLRENTARDDLSGPDLAFGQEELIKAYTKEHGKERGAVLAVSKSLSMNQSYLNKLHTVMTGIEDKAVLTHWRESSKPLPVLKMLEISDPKRTPVDRQREAYDTACKGTDKEKVKDPNAWLESAKTNAAKFGHTLGVIQACGEIEDADGMEWHTETLRALFSFKKDANGNHIKSIRAAAKAGFKAGIDEVRDAEKKQAAKEKAKAEAELGSAEAN